MCAGQNLQGFCPLVAEELKSCLRMSAYKCAPLDTNFLHYLWQRSCDSSRVICEKPMHGLQKALSLQNLMKSLRGIYAVYIPWISDGATGKPNDSRWHAGKITANPMPDIAG